jgi:hypothetical protein
VLKIATNKAVFTVMFRARNMDVVKQRGEGEGISARLKYKLHHE